MEVMFGTRADLFRSRSALPEEACSGRYQADVLASFVFRSQQRVEASVKGGESAPVFHGQSEQVGICDLAMAGQEVGRETVFKQR